VKIKKRGYVASGVLALLVLGGLTLGFAIPAKAVGNMLGYWKFDEADPGSSAVDQTANNNDLTPVNNPQPSTDRPSQLDGYFADPFSVQFSRASSQYFYLDDSESLESTADGVSIAAWVKFSTVNNN
jgi:hypothetical protein